MSKRYISASDLGKVGFCKTGYALSQSGVTQSASAMQRMSAGTKGHTMLNADVKEKKYNWVIRVIKYVMTVIRGLFK